MSIESIRARMEEHDRQRERFGYCDETAPQIWERELRALLSENAALRREVERLRDALGIVERATHVSADFPDDVSVHGKFGPMRRMAHDVAAAALEGGSDADS